MSWAPRLSFHPSATGAFRACTPGPKAASFSISAAIGADVPAEPVPGYTLGGSGTDRTMVSLATQGLLSVYRTVRPALTYTESIRPVRVLTHPSAEDPDHPHMNTESNLILRVGETIGDMKEHMYDFTLLLRRPAGPCRSMHVGLSLVVFSPQPTRCPNLGAWTG